MKYETVAQMAMRNHRDKQAGIKHTPLHTLQECCDAAGVTTQKFGRLKHQYPNAPKPVFKTTGGAARHRLSYYRRAEFVQWIKQVLQQESQPEKGTVIMPDIKTAFENALAKTQAHIAQAVPPEWDDETDAAVIESVTTQAKEATMSTQFQPTTNASRLTFNYVRDNPMLTRVQVVAALHAQGFKKSSIHSLLGQMVKQGLAAENDAGKLFALQAEYTPLKAHAKTKDARVKRKYTRRAKPEAVVEQAEVEPKVTRVASSNTLLSDKFDAQKFVDGMTLGQAKAVYDALSKIFKS